MISSERERDLIKKFLQKIPIFRHFSEENLKQVIKRFSIKKVKKGKDIVFKDDEGTDMFIVLDGQVKVSLMGKEGEEFILTTLKEGDFFGEMSLIDGKSRSANVTAEEDTLLAILKREHLIDTMKTDPAIAFDMLTSLVERLRKADDMIEALVFLGVNERLIKFLVNRAREEGNVDKDGFYRVKRYTHQEIASNIGSSREAVSKALKVLAHKNLIVAKKDYFLISPEAIREIEG